MRKILFSVGLIIFILVTTSTLIMTCTVASEPDNNRYLTGTVYDRVNGVPLAGVTCIYNGITSVTGSNGRFSFSFGDTGGTVTSDASVYKDGYEAFYIEDLVADAGKNTDIVLALFPDTDISAYPTHTLSGKIYDSTGAELEFDTPVFICVFTAKGFCQESFSIDYNGGYSVSTYITSSNAGVIAAVYDSLEENCIAYTIKRGNDLSVTNPIVNIYAPTVETLIDNITINPPSMLETGAMLCQDTPDGLIPCIFKSGGYYTSYYHFSDTNPITVSIVSPETNYPVFWVQDYEDSPFQITGFKTFTQCGSFSSLPPASSEINLSEFTDNGPSELVAGLSIDYASGIVSVGSVADANCYVFEFIVDDGNDFTMDTIASVASSSNSVTLPVWLQSRLAGKTVTISICPGNFQNYFKVDNFKYFFTLDSIKWAPDLIGADVWDEGASREIVIP